LARVATPLHYSALFPLHSYIIVFVLSTLIALPALPAFSIFSLIPTSLLQFSYFKIRSVRESKNSWKILENQVAGKQNLETQKSATSKLLAQRGNSH